MLHWLGEHYLLGNVLGISSPRGFHADKTRYFFETDHLTVDELYLRASREIPRYIARLQHDGYPYSIGLVCTGGFSVDNSPPDRRWCDLIARWNQEHADIRLRTATLSEWFDALYAPAICSRCPPIRWPGPTTGRMGREHDSADRAGAPHQTAAPGCAGAG